MDWGASQEIGVSRGGGAVGSQVRNMTNLHRLLCRCPACRQAPKGQRPAKVKSDAPYSTEASVLTQASPEQFTKFMTEHFEKLRPGVQFYNTDLVDKGAKRLLKKMRSAI